MDQPISPPKKTLTLPLLWFWAVLFFALDQLSKWGILEGLDLATVQRIDVIPGYFHFIMAWNKGVNFGLFYSDSIMGKFMLTGLPLLVALGLSWWCRKTPPFWQAMACALMIGGALGNALDRIIHGAVVDFLNMTAFGFNNPFSFNVADIWVFFGAVILIFLPAPEDKKDEESSQSDKKNSVK